MTITEPRIPLSPSLAVEQFKEAWDCYTLVDIAAILTCTEFEGILDLLLALDIVDAEMAAKIETIHAASDEPDDDHYIEPKDA